MIRSYTVGELENISGCTRRTISDYIAKGVLAGPSHRGRGARYPQKDLDVLTLLPRIRTLMKKEYPTLKDVSAFLEDLSLQDINRLATRGSEQAFVSEVRRLRVRNSLMGLLPYVAPERIESLLANLTPGQISGIDAGRYQIGAVMDIEELLHEESQVHRAPGRNANARNGYSHLPEQQNGSHTNGTAQDQKEPPTWNVSWLNDHEEGTAKAVPEGEPSEHESNNKDAVNGKALNHEQERETLETTPDLEGLLASGDSEKGEVPEADQTGFEGSEITKRLSEIAQRLEHLESILDKA